MINERNFFKLARPNDRLIRQPSAGSAPTGGSCAVSRAECHSPARSLRSARAMLFCATLATGSACCKTFASKLSLKTKQTGGRKSHSINSKCDWTTTTTTSLPTTAQAAFPRAPPERPLERNDISNFHKVPSLLHSQIFNSPSLGCCVLARLLRKLTAGRSPANWPR